MVINLLFPSLDFRRYLGSGLRSSPKRGVLQDERGLISRTAAGNLAFISPVSYQYPRKEPFFCVSVGGLYICFDLSLFLPNFLVQLSPPLRNKTKTNRDSLAYIFPPLRVSYMYLLRVFIGSLISVQFVIG